jgi:hypothetical protein
MIVIPAHPLALTAERKLDERRQRALTRYYLDSGAGGIAVGVHTTQFAIRDVGLYEPVLTLAMEEARGRDVLTVAGIAGRTAQAVREAGIAKGLGYTAGLLSLGAMRDATVDELIEHARAVASTIPVFGFYLQPAVGGRVLPYAFWRRFCDIDGVVAIKIAPFNRYATLDVVRAVADSGRDIALYTGNDDNIIADLITDWTFSGRKLRFTGGLLGHAQVTDANAALFDVANNFHGCIAGLHEILRRQGLLEGRWCLDPNEDLGPGQLEEIDRVWAAYPFLNDDDFVRENLDRWLR